METPLKQCVGIDCSKDELVARFGLLPQSLISQITASHCFTNTKAGIIKLIKWAEKHIHPNSACIYVVEATGVYHQQLAHQLHQQGKQVSVVLPTHACNFAKTLSVRTVTDHTACRALTQMGLEKQLSLWVPPQPVYSALKQLTRERKRLTEEITAIKNQLHAAGVATETLPASVDRMKERLALCEHHKEQIKKDIEQVIATHPYLQKQMEYVCSIPGIATLTAAAIIGETDGFHLIRNARQLVSYAGYDVVEKQSGSSVRGRPRISKKGNSYLRRALYFPAISAVSKDESMGGFYNRLHERHHIKMKAYTAVQRKLLVLSYTLWKNKAMYDPRHVAKKSKATQKVALHELV